MKRKGTESNLIVTGLLDYLEESGQTKLLPEVSQELQNLLQESKKADTIILTSVVPLTSPQYENLKNILRKLLNVDLPLINKIDKKLLGGFTIKVGDWFLDATLLHQIENLKQLLIS